MTEAANIDRVRGYHRALNAVDLQAIAAFFAEHAEYRSQGIGALAGKPAIMAAMFSHFAEYPGQHAIDDKIEVINPDQVRSQWRLKATSKSTGLPYARSSSEIITFGAGGLIVRVDVEDV